MNRQCLLRTKYWCVLSIGYCGSYSGKIAGSAATACGKSLPVAFPHPRKPALLKATWSRMKKEKIRI